MFDVRLCQKFLDIPRHLLVVHTREAAVCESWSVDEHDPLTVQLKLVGCLGSAGPRPQTRPTSVVHELQLQSFQSENRSYRIVLFTVVFPNPAHPITLVARIGRLER